MAVRNASCAQKIEARIKGRVACCVLRVACCVLRCAKAKGLKSYLLSRAKEVVERSDTIPREYHGCVERAAQRLCNGLSQGKTQLSARVEVNGVDVSCRWSCRVRVVLRTQALELAAHMVHELLEIGHQGRYVGVGILALAEADDLVQHLQR